MFLYHHHGWASLLVSRRNEKGVKLLCQVQPRSADPGRSTSTRDEPIILYYPTYIITDFFITCLPSLYFSYSIRTLALKPWNRHLEFCHNNHFLEAIFKVFLRLGIIQGKLEVSCSCYKRSNCRDLIHEKISRDNGCLVPLFLNL